MTDTPISKKVLWNNIQGWVDECKYYDGEKPKEIPLSELKLLIEECPSVPERLQGDLISREALKKDLASYDREFAPDWVLNCIDNAPTVEVRDNKPKQGEWIFDGWGTYCSECGDRPKIG